MAGRQSMVRIFRSIAGAAFLLLGMFFLYVNLSGAVARLRHVLASSEALGMLPAAVLAVSQAVHAYGFDHQRFLQGLLQQMLVSSWPLLLLICGTVLSRDTLADKPKPVQENNIDAVSLYSFRSTDK